MAKETKSTADRLAMLEAQLKRLGITIDEAAEPGAPQPDYIGHGSPEHMTMIGLLQVDDLSEVREGEPVYTSPKTKKTYRLEDPITAFVHFPDPMQVASLVLRQKVSVIEGGAPTAPPDAPPLWRPAGSGY